MTNSSSPLLDSEPKFFSYSDFISGWAAGTASTFVGHPMETIKVVKQVTNMSAIKVIREIYNQNKFSGFYRGMMFPILSAGVVNSVFFGIYGNVNRCIQLYRNKESNDSTDVRFCCDTEHLSNYWHIDLFISACVGGFFCSLINIPSEVIKTMLQASNISALNRVRMKSKNKVVPSTITNPIKLIIKLYKTNGLSSLYRGGSILMLRDVPAFGLYMLSYEHMCSMMKKLSYNEPGDVIEKNSMPKYIQIISGGTAGVVSWVPVLPFDVIKSKIIADSLTHPQYKGIWDCVKKTFRDGGTVRFFQGFWLVSMRAFPINSISLVVYETFLNTCDHP